MTRSEFLSGVAAAGALCLAKRSFAFSPTTQPNNRRTFREAVARGDMDLVRGMLNDDKNLLTDTDERGVSAFILAYQANHPEVAALFLERGIQLDLVEAVLAEDLERVYDLATRSTTLINGMHPVGGTPLYAAAVFGRAKTVDVLLGLGADVRRGSRPPRELTPLRAALEYPKVEIAASVAEALLSAGANPNDPQADGLSPLHAAAAAGNTEIVRILIRKGADLAVKTPSGRTALELAVERGRKEAAETLRHPERIPRDHSTSRLAETRDGKKYDPPKVHLPQQVINDFVRACHEDLDKINERLAKHPELIHARASWDEWPIEAAVHSDYPDGVEFFMGKGAAVSVCTAAMMGLGDRLKRMLKDDPLRIHERGPHDWPLMWFPAVGRGRVDMADILVSAGCDVNAHKRGRTALHLAAAGGFKELARFLLESKADIQAKGYIQVFDRWLTPQELAVRTGHAEVAELIGQYEKK